MVDVSIAASRFNKLTLSQGSMHWYSSSYSWCLALVDVKIWIVLIFRTQQYLNILYEKSILGIKPFLYPVVVFKYLKSGPFGHLCIGIPTLLD
jgi:hypothetical protein